MAEDAISLITRVRAARGVAGSGPDDEQEAAATKEGVNAARDGWVDGMEFDDAVSMGIGVAFGLSRPRAVQAEHHPRAEEVEAAARALWKMGNARIGGTPAAPRRIDIERNKQRRLLELLRLQQQAQRGEQ
jgi:hypothetical protein